MKQNLILLIVALALFMESLDATIINTAIPAMAHSLHVYPIDLKLALISYLLSLAIFIPISGWMADKFGVKKVFISAVIIFTASSFWCGFTNNLWELIIARSIQGIGGSFALPIGRLIVLRTFGRHEFINKMSMIVMVAALGMMLGPLLGGIITTHFSWRWIFWVNIPVGLINILLSYFLLSYIPTKPVPKLDKLGFIYFGSGLAALTFGMTMLSESDISSSLALSIIVFAMFLLMSYFIHSRRRAHPIVKTRLFRIRTFRVSVLGNLFSRVGFGGMPFLLPLLLQISLGFSPQLSGFLVAPTALGVFFMKPLTLPVLRLMGYKKLLVANTILVAASLWSFATIDTHTPIYLIAIMSFIFGFLISMQFSGINSLGYAEIEHDDLSAATSIVSTMQQLSQSFGVAIAAILVRFFAGMNTETHALVPKVFHQTFLTMSVMTILSLMIFVRLKPQDGHELILKEKKMMESNA